MGRLEGRTVEWATEHGLWLTLGAAALARFVHWMSVSMSDPLYAQTLPGSDMETYWMWAKTIAAVDWLGQSRGQPFYFSPLYPYFLAVFMRVFGESYGLIHAVQALVGVLPPVLLYLACRQLFGKGPALATGLMAAFCAPLLFYEQMLLTEGILVAVHAAILWTIVRGQEAPRWRWLWAFGAGVLSGLACWGRGNFLLVIGLIAMTWLIVPRLLANRPRPAGEGTIPSKSGPVPASSRKRVQAFGIGCAILYLVGAALPLAATLWRNHRVSGRWVLVTANGPINLYIGNASDSVGIVRYSESFKKLEAQYGSEAAVPWARELRRDVAAHPGAFARLLLKKTWMFWNSYDVPDNVNYYLGKRHSALVRFSPVTWLFLAPLSLLGVWETRRLWRRQVFLYVYALGFSCSIIVVFISGRFRLPVMLPMLIWAGVAVVSLADEAWRRNWSRLGIRALLLVAGVVLLWPNWSPATRYHTLKGESGARLIRDNDYNRLAIAYMKLGRGKEARRLLEEGIRQYPYVFELVDPLATIYIRDREPDKAVRVLESYLHLLPSNRRAKYRLAEALSLCGENRRARAALQELLLVDPDNRQALDLLTYLQGKP